MKIKTTYTVEFTNGFITEIKIFNNALDIQFFVHYYKNNKDIYSKKYAVRSHTAVTLFGITLKKDTNLLAMWSDDDTE